MNKNAFLLSLLLVTVSIFSVFSPLDAATPANKPATEAAKSAVSSKAPAKTPKKQVISLWFITASNPRKALDLNLQDFNKAQDEYSAEVTIVPEGTYTDRILVAGETGELPCLLFFDGPLLSYLAWLGYLQPIDRFVSAQLRDDFLPSILAQGTYNKKLYALSIYDSGLAMYANRKYLAAAGVRVPTVDRPWDLTEFETALAKLAKLPGVEYPLDMKINYGRGEFFSYGFAPILQSFGGDLIDRKTYASSSGVLDGPQSVKAMKHFQSWFQKGWANPKPEGDTDFPDRKAALSWVGHWTYSKYSEALGDDLVVIPMPDFGTGPKTGLGAWTIGIPSSCRIPDASWSLLEYFIRPDKILRWTGIHPGVPARKSALAQSELFKPEGPLNVYVQQVEAGWAIPRPLTPAYAVITKAFSEAVDNIIRGADVQSELSAAAEKIDRDIKEHNGYPAR